MSDDATLSLFFGPHVASFRFEAALEALDLDVALADCPDDQRQGLDVLCLAAAGGRSALDALVAARRPDWDARIEPAWQRLVGRALDGRGIPGVLDGEPAAAFLLRGGEQDRARQSLDRHLARKPADARAWALAVSFQGVLAAVRCVYHGGPLLPEVEPLRDLVEEDEQPEVEHWILAYAWLGGEVGLADLAAALTAARQTRPLPLPGDGAAFAWTIVEAQDFRGSGLALDPDLVRARRRLQRISPAAFRRYLARVDRAQ